MVSMLGSKWLVFVGACLAGIAVGLGAIGAHSLPAYLQSQERTNAPNQSDNQSDSQLDNQSPNQSAGLTPTSQTKIQKKLDNFEKGVRYQLFHAMAILVIGFAPVSARSRGMRIAASWMMIGILLFCGGIYGIVFTTYPTHWIVPFGGLSFITGWIFLAVSALWVRSIDLAN